MTATIVAPVVEKIAYLDWTGEGYVIHIETWETGKAPFHSFIPTRDTAHALDLLKRYRSFGYKRGE
jgi:hypothetical protein